MEPVFFVDSQESREWLAANAATAREAWIGLYKKGSGRPSITWPELVDQLLCFGWIDGLRKSLDEHSYMIRVTPRKSGSNWSAVNLRRVRELIELGMMKPEGMAAWKARDEEKALQYSYEREHAALGEEFEARFRAAPEAWEFFQAQPSSYRKSAIGWVVTAKREETMRRRLGILLSVSARGERIGLLRRE
jgi:uncharacterized protein YdeI (YjbR/CyaY-like superfamily)